jgi:hypothetical protein
VNDTPPLTDSDRRTIAQARELAALRTTAEVRERFPRWDDTAAAYAEAFGTARYLLAELADLAERLAAPTGAEADDTRRLGEIRALLSRFDWEHDDRQYALEAIERIADEGVSDTTTGRN